MCNEIKKVQNNKMCKTIRCAKNKKTCWFLWFTGTLHRHNGFYTVQTLLAIALHLPYT